MNVIPQDAQRAGRGSEPDRRPRPRPLIAIALGLLLIARPGSAGSASEFWASLLVPGWGQNMTGRKQAATGFFALEIGLWSAVFGLKRVVDIRQDNYRAYAAEHARAQPSGKDGVYFDDLGFYDSRHQHNQFVLVDAGVAAELYPDTAAFFWEWDNDGSRLRFRDLRNSAETADRQALFAVGLVVANHIVAALHARRVEVDGGDGDTAQRRSMVVLEPHPTLTGLVLAHRF